MREPVVEIDCKDVASIADFWDRYVRAIDPESARWFGRNVHALRDALTGGGPGFPGPGGVTLKGASHLAVIDDGRFLEQLREVALMSPTLHLEG